MATYDGLSRFAYNELKQFRHAELEILSLEQLMKLSPEAPSPELVQKASVFANKHGLPSVKTCAEVVALCRSLLSLAYEATGTESLKELLQFIAEIKRFF